MANKEKEEYKQIFVDLNDTSLEEGDMVEVDTNADFQTAAAPPPAKRYKLKLVDPSPGKVEIKKRDASTRGDNAGTPFYIKQFEARIISDDEWNNTVIFCKASSFKRRGMKINDQAGLMKLGGVKIPANQSDLAWVRMFERFLQKEVQMWADCDWFASEGNISDGNYKTLAATMTKFPKNPDGSFNHIIKGSTGQEVAAKFKVTKWLGKGTVATVAPTGVQAAKPSPAPVKAPVATPKPVPAPVKPTPKAIEVVEEVTVEGEAVEVEEGELVFD